MKSGTFKSDISGTFVSDTSGTFGVIYSQLGEKSLIDNLYHDLTEDSNPVLFFYKIKV